MGSPQASWNSYGSGGLSGFYEGQQWYHATHDDEIYQLSPLSPVSPVEYYGAVAVADGPVFARPNGVIEHYMPQEISSPQIPALSPSGTIPYIDPSAQLSYGIHPSYCGTPSESDFTPQPVPNSYESSVGGDSGLEICKCGRPFIPCPPYNGVGKWRESRLEHEIIPFSMYGQCGIRMTDVVNGQVTGLDGRDEHVFANTNCSQSVAVRMQWPCYESDKINVRTQDWRMAAGPTCRAKLAQKVSKGVLQYFEKMETRSFDQKHERWRVGPNFIDTRRIVLVCIERVSKGSWQPRFHLEG